jgi:predicted NBD/HSP70 family sugar kinase
MKLTMRVSDQEYNRLRVLKTLRRAEPVGRTDLAKLSHLTGGTITEISATLLDHALILEEKVASGRRGRPQIHLRMNPEGAYAIGAYIGIAGKLVCELVNLRGDQIHLSADEMGMPDTLEEFATRIAGYIGAMIEASGHVRETISRIGIALPAVVDSSTGMIHWLQTFDAPPFPAAALIERIVGIPVSIDNNTNVLARAEHWFGDDEQLDDFTLFNMGYGISGAHYSNGMLATGAHGLNSEIGHSKIVVEDGLPCGCGGRGCLDAYCSVTALVRGACFATGTPMPDLFHIAEALSIFAEEARQGNAQVRRVFERASRYMGVAIANHINAYDPGRIILLCEHPDLPEIFAGAVATAEANCLPPMKGITSIEFRAFEQDVFGKGAAALVLEQLYRSL